MHMGKESAYSQQCKMSPHILFPALIRNQSLASRNLPWDDEGQSDDSWKTNEGVGCSVFYISYPFSNHSILLLGFNTRGILPD